MKALYVLLIAALIVFGIYAYGNYQQHQFEKMLKGKAPTRKGEVKAEVINASPRNAAVVLAAPQGGFTPQARLGFTSGDQWEPAIAADRFGHVYMLYPQYEGCRVAPPVPIPLKSSRPATITAQHGVRLQ